METEKTLDTQNETDVVGAQTNELGEYDKERAQDTPRRKIGIVGTRVSAFGPDEFGSFHN